MDSPSNLNQIVLQVGIIAEIMLARIGFAHRDESVPCRDSLARYAAAISAPGNGVVFRRSVVDTKILRPSNFNLLGRLSGDSVMLTGLKEDVREVVSTPIVALPFLLLHPTIRRHPLATSMLF